MPNEDIETIIERLETLELQARQVASSIATERNNLQEALRNSGRATTPSAAAASQQSSAAQPVSIGDTVRFSSTNTVRGGTGEVIGWTRGAQPFLRIRRSEARGILPREIVRRKPHTVHVLRRASQ
jgi:hypothetical protein